jgi:hypothetical protein
LAGLFTDATPLPPRELLKRAIIPPKIIVAVASRAPQTPNRGLFQQNTVQFDPNRTHFSNNCSRFIAPAAHLHRPNRLAAWLSVFPVPCSSTR